MAELKSRQQQEAEGQLQCPSCPTLMERTCVGYLLYDSVCIKYQDQEDL